MTYLLYTHIPALPRRQLWRGFLDQSLTERQDVTRHARPALLASTLAIADTNIRLASTITASISIPVNLSENNNRGAYSS